MDGTFEEKHSGKGIVRLVCRSKSESGWIKSVSQNGIRLYPLTSISQMFKEVFLPRGYPDSVSSDYLAYQIWDSLQAFGSSITGTLATHNVLKGIGVGDASASVMSATFTWLLKDGTGMIGRIVFTYLKGSNLDVDCKKWRLFADIINDFAIGLDMICPMFPGHLTLLQCSSGFIKSLVGTIGGATRAALTQHQARNNNLADVSAKDGSQETLVNLAALITSLVLVPLISESTSFVWILFVLLTFSHIYCNYRAVKSVKMEMFNPARWKLFVEDYVFNSTTSSIEKVNQSENIWFFSFNPFQDKIHSGVPLSDHNLTGQQLNDSISNFDDQEYILSANGQHDVQISFIEGRDTVKCKLKAYCHANLILFCLNGHRKTQSLNIKPQSKIEEIVEATRLLIDQKFDRMLVDAGDKGWNPSNFIHIEDGWRVRKSEKKSN